MLTRKTVILAKVESQYGTDPTPTVSANAILVRNVDMKVQGETLQRDFLKASISQLTFVRGVRHAEVSFETELKGTGTRGSLPAFGWEGVLFRACGMLETVNAGVSIVYSPVYASFESCTLYVYKDGIFHKITGCRGTFKLNFEVGKYATVSWQFSGLYNDPADASPGAQTFSSVVPVPVLGASLSIGAYAAVAEKLEIDLNATLAPRRSLNAANGIVEWIIANREPQGSFDPETVTEATHTFWANWKAATALALNIGPIGTASGNIVTVAAPKCQYKEISYQDRSGVLAYQVPFALGMNAGDDELTITIT